MSGIYRVQYSTLFEKSLKKIGGAPAARINRYLFERIDGTDDPRQFGKAIAGELYGANWRYRVDGYRILVKILDDELIVMAVRAGARKDVYGR